MVRKLQAKYPNLPIELIVCDRVLGANIKVSNLAQMLPAARHELLLVNDSDIRVPADYLRKVITPLADASVGLVTCLYRGVASPTLGSRLEALGISTDFVPGVLSARFLDKGLHFGLGSTLAFRRRDLEAIGGFEALLDYLADDYELGRRIAATGKRVELSAATVTTFLPGLHTAAVFPPSTALVADHPGCPPLGIRRTAFHLRPAMGIGDAARGTRDGVGVVVARDDFRCAHGRWLCRGDRSAQ